ncbi:DUF6471 domain-containing protein [Brevundimonas sp. R86498]|uniref:DUF6471 domain-containing protein n=1 Tax=Brevundimonas sp. R86498 TaxID=3093845 RepID=UPI0037CA01F6
MTNETPAPTRLPLHPRSRRTEPKLILKSELKRRDLTYADLVRLLAANGVNETEANIRNKMSRGSFTAAFFLQCLLAIGCTYVQIEAPGPRD